MASFDASASALGTSAASSFALVWVAGSAAFAGFSSFAAQAGVGQLSSVFFSGESSFDWDYFVDASAVVTGISTTSAAPLVAHGARAVFLGTSSFLYSVPFVIQGTSLFSLTPVVDRQRRPIRGITMGPKTFRWLQTLQRGDLSVFICDGRRPVVPVRIAYNLVQFRLDGSRKYVGPRERSPVPGDPGEFYASGRAGEAGQPGNWLVEWVYQRTLQSSVQKTEMRFQVLDAVTVGDPSDTLLRKTKFGWS